MNSITRSRFNIVVVALVLGIGGAIITHVMAQSTVQPPVATSVVQQPGCCLTRLHKRGEGDWRVSQKGETHKCRGFNTVSNSETIMLHLKSEGPPCDEPGSQIPDGCRLTAKGTTVHRTDGLAWFSGKYDLVDAAGKPLSDGTVDLFQRIGTHHAPFGTEKCDQEKHIEGFLTGRGTGPLKLTTLRAFITGTMKPEGHEGAAVIPAASLDGVVIKCD